MEDFQLEIGIMGSVFQVPAELAAAVTGSWIKECWLDMACHNIHVLDDMSDFKIP